MTYNNPHWKMTISKGALSNPINLINRAKIRGDKGPDLANGVSGRESHNLGIENSPFSTRLSATPQ